MDTNYNCPGECVLIHGIFVISLVASPTQDIKVFILTNYITRLLDILLVLDEDPEPTGSAWNTQGRMLSSIIHVHDSEHAVQWGINNNQ